MKKITTILAAAALLLTAGAAQAGERAGAFSISPYVGGFVFDDVQQKTLVQNRPLYGLRLGYDFTDRLAAEIVGTYVRAEYKADDKHINAWQGRLDLLYNFFPHAKIDPYLAIGGGVQSVRYLDTRGGQQTDGTLNVGAGFKIFFTDDIALRLDARHIFDYQGDPPPPVDTIHNWEYSAGVSFLFGGAKPAAAKAMPPAAEPAPAPEAVTPPPPPPPAPVAEEPAKGHYKYCQHLRLDFDVDQAIIRPADYKEVDTVCDFMKKYPTTTAVIEGHTDNVGNEQHNLDLSQRRAEAVVNYLVDKCGIDRSRLSAKGYGMSRPIADNATNEGKQQNRRIEAIIDCVNEIKPITPPERLCMNLVLEFDTGKADIKPEYKSEVAKVADFLKQYPTATAVIEGHTDNTGTDDLNMKLSQKRAENVVKMLVDDFGIDSSRLSAKGYGATRRIAYNDTPEGRALNRRINAVIDCVVRK